MAVDSFEPKILAFCCNWCTYSGADLAGLNRMKYPPNVRVVRVPCSGRVNPQFILRAFMRGADGVMVCGCHPGDCHYATGNYFTRRRFMLMRELLEFNGIYPGRFHAKWISGSEAAKFRDTVTEVTRIIKDLGPMRASVNLSRADAEKRSDEAATRSAKLPKSSKSSVR